MGRKAYTKPGHKFLNKLYELLRLRNARAYILPLPPGSIGRNMALKTIKISEENYKWLVELSGEFQKEAGHPVSLDKALKMLHKGKLSELAGSWKMSDKEMETIAKNIESGWKKWKISV